MFIAAGIVAALTFWGVCLGLRQIWRSLRSNHLRPTAISSDSKQVAWLSNSQEFFLSAAVAIERLRDLSSTDLRREQQAVILKLAA